ncbi:MAG: anthranilate synthase component I family protein [Gammaproteobacteria bacterium]|nr:anthranilate synthase component I family protein [Gammaproteobacteria bacterium]MBU2678352.1 anthranilate synthase component I family protein [Gammaproteobacteria bacterium]NNC57598.1 anthranilate synthase component I family protein [Woeseiaceae bacterium]NNL52087.1 anthranilate synthase component I family protein [Woeseiaceae bacterium]
MQAPFDIAADLDTPVSAYLKLKAMRPRFLLESVEGGERLARYSFLGFGDALEVRMDHASMRVNGETQPRPRSKEEYLGALRQALALAPRPQPDDDLPFAGGLVGVSGYDVVRLFERLPRNTDPQTTVPDAAFVAPASLLVFDHLTRRVALLHDGPEEDRQRLRAEVIEQLRGPVPPPNGDASISPAEASLTEAEYSERVNACKEYIAAGDIYQIVLSVLFRGKSNVAPFEVYRALRLLNPSPYMFFFDFDDFKVVGSSPEALVKLNGNTASLRPIAGTLPRGATREEDIANEAALLADPKEAAEHVMLVDLARNDLGRVARAGSVQVDPYRAIERYSHVMHIVSGVQGRLDSEFDQFDLFAASFPAGTLVGAPKVRAMEIIEEMEQVGRGLYAGTAGYFGLSGDMDQAITIRTLVFSGDEYSFQAGAGIVADSVPAREYQEVLAKSAILRRALEIAVEGL